VLSSGSCTEVRLSLAYVFFLNQYVEIFLGSPGHSGPPSACFLARCLSLSLSLCFAAETPIEEFTPTPAFPALQYLESVDVEGVAWRAGLRTGDFLIEVSPGAQGGGLAAASSVCCCRTRACVLHKVVFLYEVFGELGTDCC